MKKYKVYDLSDHKETIGYADTITEVKKIATERYNDTDGDCLVAYAEINPELQKYMFSRCKYISTI